MKKYFLLFFPLAFSLLCIAQPVRNTLLLNGMVEFEQTRDAFPPKKFKHKIQVPGLIDLATPKIDQYNDYFCGKQEPRYSWYKFTFSVPEACKGKYAVLTLLKSRFNTQVILNGHDCGTYMQCNTPIECDLTDFLIPEGKNILLVRIGERAWLPKEAATGFDREKFTDIPGIWDDVFIAFTGPLQVNRTLLLPDYEHSKLTAKILLENYGKFVDRDMEKSEINYTLTMQVREKKSGITASEIITKKGQVKCGQQQKLIFDLNIDNPHPWSPDDPFLYIADIAITADGITFSNYGNPEIKDTQIHYPWTGKSDQVNESFGMRDFKAVERSFELNGEPFRFFGSTITLNRFFEDRERSNLPWDKEWVEKMFIEIPKSLGWNGFRICIGLLPDFWYDLADQHGIVLQNEYPMWNLRGRDIQFYKEYTDWVWADGNHPSIIIWDALNEQKNEYLGNVVIPSLRKLDPSRIWDAGYMSSKEMSHKEMAEVHWYPLGHGWWFPDAEVERRREVFRFGSVFFETGALQKAKKLSYPLILNEYGWLWLNRDGIHSGVRTEGNFKDHYTTPYTKNYEYYEVDGTQMYSNRDVYDYYVGKDATPEDRWRFQAYLLAIESETARSARIFSGFFSFPYLANNLGHTGDWFIDIKNLKPAQALLAQYHTHKAFAVFIDMEDGRYIKNPKSFSAGEQICLNLFAVNDSPEDKTGTVNLKITDKTGKTCFEISKLVSVKALREQLIPISVTIPDVEGGYIMIAELDDNVKGAMPQNSIRYFRVGGASNPAFPDFKYEYPPEWPK